jgi:Holliday junction DNA helicase RuvA
MINKIRGVLTGSRNDSLYVATGGIEWDISVPSRELALYGSVGQDVEVFIWLQHYDEGMRLFGFPSAQERTLFLDLIKVEGIGPKQALKILSGISPVDLALALDAGNLSILQKISGVGPKLAQKMVLALKGKLVDLEVQTLQSASSVSPWNDLIRALVDMGFDRRTVENTVKAQAIGLSPGEEGEKELFRRALMDLSTGGSSR